MNRDFERLRRDKNFLELNNKRLFNKLTKVEMERDTLKKSDCILTKVEEYLQHRIKKLADVNESKYSIAILELKKLSDALEYERNSMEIDDYIEEDV